MLSCIQAFENYYKRETEKRKLTWLYSQGNVILTRHLPPPQQSKKKVLRKVDLSLSCIQATILLLFNAPEESYTLQQIQDQLNLNGDVLRFSITPLFASRNLSLLQLVRANAKEGEKSGEREYDPADVVKLAPMKRYPKKRLIPYPPGSIKMQKKQSQQIHEKTKKDRGMKIELALVRVMKARNVCTQNELISQASSQLMKFFRPDPRQMKKKIESLFERGFMRRDDGDQRLIHYVA